MNYRHTGILILGIITVAIAPLHAEAISKRLALDQELSPKQSQQLQGLSLMLAEFAKNNNNDLTEFLLKESCYISPNMPDYKGNTALHKAAQSGAFKMVQLLIEKANADWTIKNRQQKTPAQVAQEAGHPEVAQWIEEYAKNHVPERLQTASELLGENPSAEQVHTIAKMCPEYPKNRYAAMVAAESPAFKNAAEKIAIAQKEREEFPAQPEQEMTAEERQKREEEALADLDALLAEQKRPEERESQEQEALATLDELIAQGEQEKYLRELRARLPQQLDAEAKEQLAAQGARLVEKSDEYVPIEMTPEEREAKFKKDAEKSIAQILRERPKGPGRAPTRAGRKAALKESSIFKEINDDIRRYHGSYTKRLQSLEAKRDVLEEKVRELRQEAITHTNRIRTAVHDTLFLLAQYPNLVQKAQTIEQWHNFTTHTDELMNFADSLDAIIESLPQQGAAEGSYEPLKKTQRAIIDYIMYFIPTVFLVTTIQSLANNEYNYLKELALYLYRVQKLVNRLSKALSTNNREKQKNIINALIYNHQKIQQQLAHWQEQENMRTQQLKKQKPSTSPLATIATKKLAFVQKALIDFQKINELFNTIMHTLQKEPSTKSIKRLEEVLASIDQALAGVQKVANQAHQAFESIQQEYERAAEPKSAELAAQWEKAALQKELFTNILGFLNTLKEQERSGWFKSIADVQQSIDAYRAMVQQQAGNPRVQSNVLKMIDNLQTKWFQ